MKSHFQFTKAQRNGIFLLLLIIVFMQGLYYLTNSPEPDVTIDQATLEAYRLEIDSLRLVKIEQRKPKIYPFNPNFISDYKGYTLGMSNEEIDRLLSFREQGKWINSTRDFQQVTGVSDSLLAVISPFFKFPEWVKQPKPEPILNFNNYNSPKSFNQKIDLNGATARELRRVNGIGEKLSERIIRYRDKFEGGLIADIQLQDIYGLSPEVMDRVLNEFTVKTPRPVEKLDLNQVNIEALVTIQHIDYELAYEIVEFRTLHEGFQSLEELKKVKGFPVNKFEIIELYLTLD